MIEAIENLFTRKNRAMDDVLPSAADLFQHVNKMANQAGYFQNNMYLHSQIGAGKNVHVYIQTPVSIPLWTSLQNAADSCKERMQLQSR